MFDLIELHKNFRFSFQFMENRQLKKKPHTHYIITETVLIAPS